MNRLIKNAIFGAIGGVAGTAVIGQAMGILSKLQPEKDRKLEEQLISENPTEKLARVVVEDALGIRISGETKSALGQAVRWGYGIGWGAVYGILRNEFPVMAKAGGLPFGIGLSLLGWTVLLPMFNLTPPPQKLPVSTHAQGLVSHYAYAAAVEGVCRLCNTVEQAATGAPQRTKPELRRVS
ncbi:MAG TPA: DUF1440 domain-containing protein [Terriglobia bacterium]|jgi:putative membrane protein